MLTSSLLKGEVPVKATMIISFSGFFSWNMNACVACVANFCGTLLKTRKMMYELVNEYHYDCTAWMDYVVICKLCLKMIV